MNFIYMNLSKKSLTNEDLTVTKTTVLNVFRLQIIY
jgi:hypothetical protein